MPAPDLLTTARDVGGWVFAAVVISATLYAVFKALQQGTLVPVALLTRALDQNEKLTISVDRLTVAVQDLARQVSDLSRRAG